MTTTEEPTAEELAAVEKTVHHLPAVIAHEALIAKAEITPGEVVAQRDKIKQVMAEVMTDGVHYGIVPGVSKPSLLKPGAEVLLVTFRLAPAYNSEKIFHEGTRHLTVSSRCTLTHIPSGLVIGEGEGLCTTLEKKYAYRGGGRTCPACGASAIKKSKFPPRVTDYPGAQTSDPPGWYCHNAAGGCGANFAAADPAITDQSTDRVENPDLPDEWNTVLKMGGKRALIAAILNATAASDIFTQDVEDGSQGAKQEAQKEEAGWSMPAGFKQPKSWGELRARMVELGVPEPDQEYWLKPALENVDNELKFVKAKIVLARLTDKGGIEVGDADPRGVMQEIIAVVFDGLEVEGPPWRIHPDEEHRPTFDEWTLSNMEPPEAGAYPEDENIQF